MYIDSKETENLFSLLPLLEVIRENSLLELQIEKDKQNIENDEYIYTLTVGNKVMNDMPYATTNEISNPTENVANNYEKIMNKHTYDSRKEIIDEIFIINEVSGKMENALRKLSPLEQELLKLKFWQKKKWKEINDDLKEKGHYCSISGAQKIKSDSIDMITKATRIRQETYQAILRIVEGSVEV